MKSDVSISDIKRTGDVASTKDGSAGRTWSAGLRTSRTDSAMVPALTVAMVDAVFEEHAVNFGDVSIASENPPAQKEQASLVESLASQLATLEDQCVNLRRMLELAACGPR